MDKTITTALLIVISMVMAIMLFNVAYPAIIQSGDAITSMTSRADERMRSQVTIIHMTGELDSAGGWADTNGNGDFDAFIWVKNTGTARIVGLEYLDVFFGPEGNFARIPHQSAAGGTYPYWEAQVETGGDWTPASTLRITIHYAFPLATGRYFARVTVPSGVTDADYMSM